MFDDHTSDSYTYVEWSVQNGHACHLTSWVYWIISLILMKCFHRCIMYTEVTALTNGSIDIHIISMHVATTDVYTV